VYTELRISPTPDLPLALLLTRLSWPWRLAELRYLFGRSAGYLSTVWTQSLLHLDREFGRLVQWHPMLEKRRIKYYARKVQRRGHGRGIVWGWIDGTFLPTCRPLEDQRRVYSGYKKRHGIKFQGIVTPDGLMTSCDGPYLGEANDNRMVRESGLETRLREVFPFPS
jgi:hypothetical protein